MSRPISVKGEAPSRSRSSRARRNATAAAVAVVLVLSMTATIPTWAEEERTIGETVTFAHIPEPGHPEGIAVDGDAVYVTGPASWRGLLLGVDDQARIWRFDLHTGTPGDPILLTLPDEVPFAAAALAVDGQGRVYVLVPQAGVVRVDPKTGSQELYATFPDLPPCGSLAPEPPACAPTLLDRAALPNDLAFDATGNLYVTDTFQATIWRVAPGGEEVRAWFQHPALAQAFGPNGIRIGPDGRLYFSVVSRDLQPLHPNGIYTLPLEQDPAPNDLKLFAQISGVDGMAFGSSGLLYAVTKSDNQVAALRPDGTEAFRVPDRVENLQQEVPYDSPATLAFHDGRRSILVTNAALESGEVLPERFAVLETFVDDTALPLARPEVP